MAIFTVIRMLILIKQRLRLPSESEATRDKDRDIIEWMNMSLILLLGEYPLLRAKGVTSVELKEGKPNYFLPQNMPPEQIQYIVMVRRDSNHNEISRIPIPYLSCRNKYSAGPVSTPTSIRFLNDREFEVTPVPNGNEWVIEFNGTFEALTLKNYYDVPNIDGMLLVLHVVQELETAGSPEQEKATKEFQRRMDILMANEETNKAPPMPLFPNSGVVEGADSLVYPGFAFWIGPPNGN